MKAKMKPHKLLSLLLALVMVVGLLPMGQVAYAYSEGDIAGTTGSGASEADPVVCNTFAEFKAAMENTEITYVKLTDAKGDMPSQESLAAAISNTTEKVLTIEGTNKFWSPLAGMNDCLIWPRADLTINGNGTLKYEHGNTGGTGAVINMASPNISLTINENVTLEGGNNGATFGQAIFATAGNITINGGNFIGYDAFIQNTADVSAVLIAYSANLTINGGNFSASLHKDSPEGKNAKSLTIDNNATGAISIKAGTFSQGIDIEATGKTIENCGYFDTAKASITAGGNPVETTASTDVLKNTEVIVTATAASTKYSITVTGDGNPKAYFSGVQITEQEAGKAVALLADETYNGLVFDKWISDDVEITNADKYNSAYFFMPAKEVTVTATYKSNSSTEPTKIESANAVVTAPDAGANPSFTATPSDSEKYTVTVGSWYDGTAGKNLTESDTFTAGHKYYLRVVFAAKTGYTFDSSTVFTINGESTNSYSTLDGYRLITFDVPAASTKYSITVTGDGNPKAYFSGVQITEQEAGKAVALLADETYNGLVFDKWISDDVEITNADKYNSAYFFMPAKEVTVTATYKSNSSTEPTKIESANAVVTAPDAGANPSFTATPSDSEKYTVTVGSWYDGTAGKNLTESDTFTAGHKYYLRVVFAAKTGYTFDSSTVFTINGESTNSYSTLDGYRLITFDVPAASTEYSITVTDGKATVGAGTEITKAAEGTAVTLTANAAPTDKVFDKWEVVSGSITLADANSATTTFTMPAGAVSVKATYKDKPVTTYTVSFDANGGTGSMAAATGVSGDYVLPVCGFTAPNGKQFKAWSVDGVEKAVGDKITVTANTTVTAVWEAVEYNVTVTGGTASVGAGTPITKATMGTTVTLTAGAAPTGQMFDKWVVNGVVVDDANSATTTFVMPAGNVTAEATYKNIPVVTYTVSFDANGGTGSMADATGVSGDYVLPVCGFTAPNGKQFKAWSVGGVEKAAGDTITVNANTTVTAIWETIPAGHTCDIKPVAKVEPSCTEGGKEAYYKCEGCGKFYEDALGTKEITDLASWGNLAKLGHTESDWKSDKDNHWKECTVAGCGVIIENSKAAHADANNDGKCDTCEYNVGIPTTPGGDKPNDNPQTGDNSMMWLWIALLFVSGFGVVTTTVYTKKRKSVK